MPAVLSLFPRFAVALCLLVPLPNPAVADEPPDPAARARLDAAWQAFQTGLDEARDSLVNPAYFPPTGTERNLAEGHRYLLGHLGRLIEQEMRLDPRFPEFHRSVDMLRKHTGENPDAIYLKAPIDGRGTYRIRGRAADASEWQSSSRIEGRPKAPRLVTFQTITGVPGDTGALEEMGTCRTQQRQWRRSPESARERHQRRCATVYGRRCRRSRPALRKRCLRARAGPGARDPC
jgi:hypothetical protein